MTENAPHLLYDAAMKLKSQGDLEGCVAGLRQVLTVDPNHVHSHMALAVQLQKLGHAEEAVSHARRVTEIEPNEAFSFTQLSVICMRCGRILEAEEAMAKARALQGHHHH